MDLISPTLDSCLRRNDGYEEVTSSANLRLGEGEAHLHTSRSTLTAEAFSDKLFCGARGMDPHSPRRTYSWLSAAGMTGG